VPFDLSSYEPVEDRLRAFWKDHPDGRIITTLVKAEAGEFIVKAEAWTADLKTVATGLAHEREGSTVVNKTSALENCETSAIGRALANLGYAAKGKRPSREEMSKTSAPSPTGQKTSIGEADGVDIGPGEVVESSLSASPGPPCDHHYASGAPAKVIKGGREICKKCGMPWVSVVESTTEDLGGP